MNGDSAARGAAIAGKDGVDDEHAEAADAGGSADDGIEVEGNEQASHEGDHESEADAEGEDDEEEEEEQEGDDDARGRA